MKRHLIAITASLALGAATAFGQLTWGINGGGGTGTWDTSTLNWWNGTTNVAWVDGGQAVFAGTPGTVTFNAGSVGKLTFNVPGYSVNSSSISAVTGGMTVEANADATVGSSIFGPGSNSGPFTKSGAGTLTITRSLVFFNQVAVSAGELKFAGTSPGDAGAVYSLANAAGVAMTLGLSGSSSFFIGGLAGGGTNGGNVRPDNIAGTQTLSIFGSGSSFAGVLQDNGAGILALSSSGTQEFTAANTYSGASTVSGGTLTFSQGGTALNSAFKITGGTLLLDNTARNVADRVSDVLPITVAATLSLRGNGGAPSAETLGPLRFGATRGTIDISPNPAQPAVLVFDSLSPRATGQNGVLYFQGPGLGSAAGPGVASVRFTNAPVLIGGSGSDGTPNLSILPATLGAGSSGTTFNTYGLHGIRPLADTEYSGDLLATGAFGNASIGTAIDVAGPAAVNALRLKAGGAIGGSGTLTVGSGMILAQPGSGSLTVSALDFGGAEGIVTAESDIVISSAILGSSAGNGLTKNGTGRLTLTGTSSYTGTTNILGGTLAIAKPSALGDATGAVTVQSGAALEFQDGITIGTKPLTVIGSGPGGTGSLRSRSGDNAWNGAVSLRSVAFSVDAGSLSFGGTIALSGRLTKTGAGTLILNSAVNAIFADLTIFGGPIISHATAGIPFTDGSLALYGTPATFAPAGTGADVALTEGERTFASAAVITFNQGNSTVILDKGANTSLTLTLQRSAPTALFSRGGKATLVFAASGGTSALGASEKLTATSVGPQPIPLTNGIVTPAILGQDNDANRSGDFLTFNTTVGLLKATYSASPNIQSAGAFAIFNASTPQTLTANAAVYALKNSGQTIDLNSKTLTLGNSSNSSTDPTGLILNGGSITGGAVTVAKAPFSSSSRGELTIYTSLAGGSITSNFNPVSSSFGFDLTTFGPGLLSLSGNAAGALTVNSGGVRIGGTITGGITLFGDGTLSGTGKTSSTISGGRISPGNSAGIFTAAKVVASASSSPSSGVSAGPPSFTAFAFEFTKLGVPTFNTPTASGNDVLRLTDATTPFGSALTADNEIAVYFNLTTGVHLGDTFFGGFFTDKNAAFEGSILGALWRVFLADPLGETEFNGTKYRASTDGVLVSTVPQTANFGAGNVNGYITRVTIVPEPGVMASLLGGIAGLLSRAGSRRSHPRR